MITQSPNSSLHNTIVVIHINLIYIQTQKQIKIQSMVNSPDKTESSPKNSKISPEKYARLRAEAKAPYKGFRKVFYLVGGASGLIGAFIFLLRIAAGTDVSQNLPNLAIQLGVIGIAIALWRWDK